MGKPWPKRNQSIFQSIVTLSLRETCCISAAVNVVPIRERVLKNWTCQNSAKLLWFLTEALYCLWKPLDCRHLPHSALFNCLTSEFWTENLMGGQTNIITELKNNAFDE